MHCFANPRRHQKPSTKSFPVIKKISLPKCTGKLAGWFVFLLTLGKRTAGRAQKKKKSVRDNKR